MFHTVSQAEGRPVVSYGISPSVKMKERDKFGRDYTLYCTTAEEIIKE